MTNDLAELNNCCFTCVHFNQYFSICNQSLHLVSMGECSLTRKTQNPLRDVCDRWSEKDFAKEKEEILDDLTLLTNTIYRQIENIVLVLKELT